MEPELAESAVFLGAVRCQYTSDQPNCSCVACSRHMHRAGRGRGHVAVNGQGAETVELCSVRFRMVDSSAEKKNLTVMEKPPVRRPLIPQTRHFSSKKKKETQLRLNVALPTPTMFGKRCISQ